MNNDKHDFKNLSHEGQYVLSDFIWDTTKEIFITVATHINAWPQLYNIDRVVL